MALDGVLANIPGLAGYLAMQRHQQQRALGGLQGAMGVLQAVQRQEEMQREAQMAPLRMQAMQAQVQQAQAAADQQRARQAFFANAGQFMTPGPPEVAPGRGVMGGMDDGSIGQIMGVAPGENGAPAAKPGPMQFDLDRFVTQGAMQGVFSPEALLNRQQQLEERQAQRQQRMQELEMRLADARATAQERMAFQRELAQMRIDSQRDLANVTRAIRQSSGGSDGDSRREPFKFSLDGRNIQGWRDRNGNVFTPDGRAVTNYQPEVTSADQSAAQRRQTEQETYSTLQGFLNRIERVANANPGTVAGVAGQARNFLAEAWNQVVGNVTDTSVVTPAQQARQLRDAVIQSMGNLGRLSNADRERIESIWGLGAFGSPAKIREAISLTREIVNARYAGANVDVGRSSPGAPAGSGGVSDEDLVNKYLNRGR